MGLLEEAQAEKERRRPPGCAVGKALKAMDKKDAADLQQLLDDIEGYDAPVIVTVLANRGFRASQHAVQTHRRKGCCGQSR